MIALRRRLERGLRHPVLGPLCLLLLAILVAFTVLHGVHDQLHSSDDVIVCVAILVSAIGREDLYDKTFEIVGDHARPRIEWASLYNGLQPDVR